MIYLAVSAPSFCSFLFLFLESFDLEICDLNQVESLLFLASRCVHRVGFFFFKRKLNNYQ